MNRKNNLKFNQRWANHTYLNTYIRVNKNKHFTYKYHFYWDHDEDLNTPHVKDPNKPEYTVVRGGKRAVFYENIDEREQIPNDKK